MERIKKMSLVLVFIFLFLVQFSFSQEGESDNVQIANSLFDTYSLDGISKSLDIFKEIINKDPNNYEALWKASRALNTTMDIKTNQAIITIEGLSDTEENKKIWKELGKEALGFSKRARELNPEGTDAMIWDAVSYAYYSSSFGILKAIFSGAAGKFKENANLLINTVPEALGGLGNRHLGILYLAAPFPVGSTKKAEINMKKALEINNMFLSNHYYYGLALYRLKNYTEAEKEFLFVVQNEPQPGESHCIQAFKNEAEKFIALITKE